MGGRGASSGNSRSYHVKSWEAENSSYYNVKYTKDAQKVFERVKTASVGTEITVLYDTSFLGNTETHSIKYRVTGTPKNKVLEEISGSKSNWDWYDGEPEARLHLTRETSRREMYDRFSQGESIIIRRTPLTKREKKAIAAERAADRRQYRFSF